MNPNIEITALKLIEPSLEDKARRHASHVYVVREGETVFQNYINRRYVPLGRYRSVVEEAVKQTGLKAPKVFRIHKSDPSGQAPAYVGDDWIRDKKDRPYDMFVIVRDTDVKGIVAAPVPIDSSGD